MKYDKIIGIISGTDDEELIEIERKVQKAVLFVAGIYGVMYALFGVIEELFGVFI